MNFLSWVSLFIVNIRLFSNKKYKNVLWVYREVMNGSRKPVVYRNTMRIVSLIRTGDPAWKNEALWLIKRNRFGDVSKDERAYLLQYINQQSDDVLKKYCTHEAIDFSNVSRWVKKNFPLCKL